MIPEVVYYLKVDYDKVMMYIANLKVTTKILIK